MSTERALINAAKSYVRMTVRRYARGVSEEEYIRIQDFIHVSGYSDLVILAGDMITIAGTAAALEVSYQRARQDSSHFPPDEAVSAERLLAKLPPADKLEDVRIRNIRKHLENARSTIRRGQL